VLRASHRQLRASQRHAGDNDHRREAQGKPNVGGNKAEEAAAVIGGFALLPAFAEKDAGSDWNDLARGRGREVARQQLVAAIAVAEREQAVHAFAAALVHLPEGG
jgi:phage/plasmid primase-like uncharacterized protein